MHLNVVYLKILLQNGMSAPSQPIQVVSLFEELKVYKKGKEMDGGKSLGIILLFLLFILFYPIRHSLALLTFNQHAPRTSFAGPCCCLFCSCILHPNGT